MNIFLVEAGEELKRIDHLVYVSLKYTRTVDVLKSIVERMISALDLILDYLVAVKKGGNPEEPEVLLPSNRVNEVQRLYSDDQDIMELISFYAFMRKLSRASFKKSSEFRRHVTMTAKDPDGERDAEVDIDIITSYYLKVKEIYKGLLLKVRGDESD